MTDHQACTNRLGASSTTSAAAEPAHPRRAVAVGTLGCAFVATFILYAPRIVAADSTVWDGVYTRAQGQRGQAVYKDQCALCHGDRPAAGTGGAPPLAGNE